MKISKSLKEYCTRSRKQIHLLCLPLMMMAGFLFTPVVFSNEMPAARSHIELGIIPYLSPRNLLNNYVPLLERLQKVLGKRVEIYSSNSFSQFMKSAQKGEYDILIAPAHLARLLQREQHFVPVLKFSGENESLIVVSKKSHLQSLASLRQHTLAVPDKLALASIVALTYLKRRGIDPEKDLKLLVVPSFASAILALQNGEAQAAISASSVLSKMPADLSNAVTPLVNAGPYANLVVMAAPSLNSHQINLIRQSLLKTGSNHADTDRIIAAIGLGELQEISDAELQRMDSYLPETRNLLETRQ